MKTKPQRHTISEADWLACRDPVRMPRHAKDRATERKCVLLGAAYLLDVPGVLQTPDGRRFAEIVRAAVSSHARFADGRAAAEVAATRAFPSVLPSIYPGLWQHPRLKSDSGTLAKFIYLWRTRTTGASWRGALSQVADEAFRRVREAPAAAATKALERVRQECGPGGWWAAIRGVWGGPRQAPSNLKAAVLELLPEAERERYAALTWTTGIPPEVTGRLRDLAAEPHRAAAATVMADLVRDVFGNPHHPVVVRTEWRECNHGAVRKIAEHVDRTGAFDELPILADALEEAGCDNPAMLSHCRDAKRHAPGCWVVDAVLGRE